jgi:hypothetical protein
MLARVLRVVRVCVDGVQQCLAKDRPAEVIKELFKVIAVSSGGGGKKGGRK